MAWTSGLVGDYEPVADPVPAPADNTNSRLFHTVTSAMGTAVHWQCRVHYYW